MLLPVTTIYAAALAVIALILSAGAGTMRAKLKTAVGDGGNEQLHLAMRRHGNFVEYVPLLIVLIAIIELNGAPGAWIHGLGASLVAARIAHPFGIGSISHPARFFGAAVTALVLLASTGILAWQAYAAM